VVLDTVEVILVSGSAQQTETDSEDLDSSINPEVSGGGATSWLGSGTSWWGSGLRALALRAGLNISITVRNLLAKYIHPDGFVITVALEKLNLCSSTEEWKNLVKNPGAWLCKMCTAKGLSVALDPNDTDRPSYLPLLRMSSVTVSALVPIYAYIEGVELGEDVPKITIEVRLSRVTGALNDQQIVWSRALLQSSAKLPPSKSFTSSIPVIGAEIGHSGELESQIPLGTSRELAPRQGGTGGTSIAVNSRNAMVAPIDGKDGRSHREEMKAPGVFGKIWDLMIDEASYIQRLEEQNLEEEGGNEDLCGSTASHSPRLPPAGHAIQGLPMHAELCCQLDGLAFQFGKVGQLEEPPQAPTPILELEVGVSRVFAASVSDGMQFVQVELQSLSVRHNASRENSDGNLWDEVLGIYPWPLKWSEHEEGEVGTSALLFSWVGEASLSPEDVQTDELIEAGCTLRIGKIWGSYKPVVLDDVHTYLKQPFTSLEQLVETREVVEPESANAAETAGGVASPAGHDQKDDLLWWLATKLNIEFGILQIAFVSETSCGSKALVLLAESFMFAAGPGYSLNRLQTSLSLAVVVDESWEVRPCRAGFSEVPGSISVCQPITLSRGDGKTSVAVSPIDIQVSGQHVDAILSCFVGSTTESLGILGPSDSLIFQINEGALVEYCPYENAMQQSPQFRATCNGLTLRVECPLSSSCTTTVQLDIVDISVDALPKCSVSASLVSMQLYRWFQNAETLDELAPLLLVTHLLVLEGDEGRTVSVGCINMRASSETFFIIAAILERKAASLSTVQSPPLQVSAGCDIDKGRTSLPTSILIDMVSMTLMPPISRQFESYNHYGLMLWSNNVESKISTPEKNVSVGTTQVQLVQVSAGEEILESANVFR